MGSRQRRLAQQLVAAGLSRGGYAAATIIMGLETLLDALEGWRLQGPVRDTRLYYVSVFGAPDPKTPWGWRFEGHHISLNYTIVDGRIIAPTPTFFGANPADTQLGGAVLRPLAGIEDLARQLVRDLDEAQRAAAVVAPAAPPDIVTANRPKLRERILPIPARDMMAGAPTDSGDAYAGEWRGDLGLAEEHVEALRYGSSPRGLAARSMNAAQRELLSALLREYLGKMPDEVAEIETAKLQRRGFENLFFAWAGSLEPRKGHYYRLQGPGLLVEYDNTQNAANHIHSVWRDLTNDFGADLLARHYARDHGR